MSHNVIPFLSGPLRAGRRGDQPQGARLRGIGARGAGGRGTGSRRSATISPDRATRRDRRYQPELVPAPDPEMDLVARNIDRAGLHLVHVGESCDCGSCAAEPAPLPEQFGYTVGLTEHGHPELLVRGLGAQETAELLGRWGGTVLAGDVFAEGHLLCEGPDGARWELAAVHRARGELVWATRYYGRDRIGPDSALELVPTRRPCQCGGCA